MDLTSSTMSSAAAFRPTKKRRSNRTLKDYFPSKKKSSAPVHTANDNHFLFSSLPSALLHHQIFRFLTVQDLTHVSQTCHLAAHCVDAYRGPLPYIVREALGPYKLHYTNFDPDTPPNECLYFEACRARTVRFLLKTNNHHRVVQVEVKMGQWLWSESLHRGIGIPPHDDSKTWVEIKIFRQIKERTTTTSSNGGGGHAYRRILLLESFYCLDGTVLEDYYLEHYCNGPLEVGSLMDRDEDINHAAQTTTTCMPIQVEHTLQQCTNYFWVCANRIARSPKHYNLPSLAYLVRNGLPPSLHRFLPVPITNKEEEKEEPTHNPGALWKFNPGKGRRAFHGKHSNYVRDSHGQFTKEFFINDIPWYSKWYPKEQIIHPKYPLSSLASDIVANHICSFLTDEEANILKEQMLIRSV